MSFNPETSLSPEWESRLQSAVSLTNVGGANGMVRADYDDLMEEAIIAGHNAAAGRAHRDAARNEWQDGNVVIGLLLASNSVELLLPYIDDSRQLMDEYGVSTMYLARAEGVNTVNATPFPDIKEKLGDVVLPGFEGARQILTGAENSWYRFGTNVRGATIARLAARRPANKTFMDHARDTVDVDRSVLGVNGGVTKLYKLNRALVAAPTIIQLAGENKGRQIYKKLVN